MKDSDQEANRKGKEKWVVLVLLCLLLVLEIAARLSGSSLSKDLAHLETLPAAASRIAACEDEPTLLIVGNSLARNGIDSELVRKNFPHVEYFYPDGSSVSEWSWALNRYFLEEGAVPDQIWVVTGRGHLVDSSVVPERLGAYWVENSDVEQLSTP